MQRNRAQVPQPCLEEFDIGRRDRQLQWIETGGHTVLQRQIFASQCAHQNLETAILIEDDLSRALAIQQGDQKADEHCLARAGGTANECVAGIFSAAAIGVGGVAGMQRKIIGRARAGDEQAHRVAPMISRCPPGGIVVKRRHRREVSRRDRRLARSNGEIARQLRPEGGFQRQILPCDQHAGVGEKAARQRNMIVECFETASSGGIDTQVGDARQYLKGEMMIAHDEFVARERVQCVLELRSLGDGEVAGIRHSIELALQQRLARALRQERKGLCQYEGEWRRQEPVVHPDHTWGWIFLDTEHCADGRRGRRAVFDGLGAEK